MFYSCWKHKRLTLYPYVNSAAGSIPLTQRERMTALTLKRQPIILEDVCIINSKYTQNLNQF